jgi:hypothetical protein
LPNQHRHHNGNCTHGKKGVLDYLEDKICLCREREDRNAIKKEDFILDKLKDQTIYRLPGSVNGQQFISMFKIQLSSFNR